MMARRRQRLTNKKSKALDSAVRKIESKEKRQDDRSGKTGKPVKSIGQRIRQGWTEGA